jgi:hypothetical protein
MSFQLRSTDNTVELNDFLLTASKMGILECKFPNYLRIRIEESTLPTSGEIGFKLKLINFLKRNNYFPHGLPKFVALSRIIPTLWIQKTKTQREMVSLTTNQI